MFFSQEKTISLGGGDEKMDPGIQQNIFDMLSLLKLGIELKKEKKCLGCTLENVWQNWKNKKLEWGQNRKGGSRMLIEKPERKRRERDRGGVYDKCLFIKPVSLEISIHFNSIQYTYFMG